MPKADTNTRDRAAILLVVYALGCSGSPASPVDASPGSAADTSVSAIADSSVDDTLAELRAVLDGSVGHETENALRALAPVLGAGDWAYLANAMWPNDVTLVVGDERLQRALSPFVSHVAREKAVRDSLRQQVSVAELAEVQALLERARALLVGKYGAVTLQLPACVAAFCKALGSKLVLPLPEPGPAADWQTQQKVITFYANSQSLVEAYVTPLCCRGEVTFPSGKLICYDSSSCRGQGEPGPGSVTVRSSSSANPCGQRICGSDGFGRSCGSCPVGSTCDVTGQCAVASATTCCDVNGGGIAANPCFSGLYVKCRGSALPPTGCTPLNDGDMVNQCCTSATGETCTY
jgi:hypothetical protein